MQLSGQYDNVEFTALAREDCADNSDVPKIQRESIRAERITAEVFWITSKLSVSRAALPW
jgi:hypothetical protein